MAKLRTCLWPRGGGIWRQTLIAVASSPLQVAVVNEGRLITTSVSISLTLPAMIASRVSGLSWKKSRAGASPVRRMLFRLVLK